MKTLRAILVISASILVCGCASLSGFPKDPIDNAADTKVLIASGGADQISIYENKTDNAERTNLRNKIVYARIALYDIAFSNFERGITGEGNTISLGGDTTSAILNAIGTAVKNAASKTTYSAAALGVTGITSDAGKDLFYKNTISAIVTQMQANRLKVLTQILQGLSSDDAKYSLDAALVDLERYKDAGNIPGAITAVSASAENAKEASNDLLSTIRSTKYVLTSSGARMVAWYFPHGDPTKAPNSDPAMKLSDWMRQDTVDPYLAQIPPTQLIYGSFSLAESDRTRAIKDLNIP